MAKSELCKKCAHTKVCVKDKNLLGDVFVPGNPMFFDNTELYKKYEERKAKGFPCDDFLEVVRCKDCKHKYLENDVWTCPFGLAGGSEFFCGYGERRTDA